MIASPQPPREPAYPHASRRAFLARASTLGVGLAAGPWVLPAGQSPARRIRVAVMGLNRGMAHCEALRQIPDVEVAYLCDVDGTRLNAAMERVNARQTRPARAVRDIRLALEDPRLDALTIAAPNHWQAPATILACAAGKHVYVEKPGSHNLQEIDWMIASARRHDRRVQLGTQRRSWPAIREMVERLQGGLIGRIAFARSWYSNSRGSIGHGRAAPVPETLDFDLWQGPAPERPYVDNLVHYNWHWRWHWGGGELANNGVHALDLLRWGLAVDQPRRVTFGGGRYAFADDQETPDTGAAVFDFGSCGASWEVSSCLPRTHEQLPFVAFYGEGGCVTQEGGGYRVFDDKGNLMESKEGPGGDLTHFNNFIDAIREGTPLHAEIAEGQKAARLCHWGNIAWRTASTIDPDPATGKISNNREALRLTGREYRPGWTPRA